MNKKGQSVGLFIGIAIAIIVGLILFQAVASNVKQGTQTVTGVSTANITTDGAVLATPYPLTGQELVTLNSVTNSTNGVAIGAVNYTVAECVRSTDNLKGICYTADVAGEAVGEVTVNYDYYPEGYIDNAGSRAIAGIIILLTAIGIALVAMKAVREP